MYKRACASAEGTGKDQMRQKGNLLRCSPFLLFEFFSMCVWSFHKAEHSCQSKKVSYVPVHENGMISIKPIGNPGTTPGGTVHRSVTGWGRAYPLGDKTHTENLYEVELISKYWVSLVGVEVVGGAIQSRYFHFMLFLIWVTVNQCSANIYF